MYRVLEEQGGSTFQEVFIDLNSEEAVFEDRHFFRGSRINGIAYRPADNLIYGVLLGDPYVLCRIDADYQLEQLRPLSLPSDMLFVSGDVSPDERHLVLLGFTPETHDNLLVLIDLSDPAYPTSVVPLAKTNPAGALYCADIAFHPTLDLIYGFEHSEGRLITIDLNTGLVDNTSYPPTDVLRGNMPSLFFDERGNLFGVGAEERLYTERNLYQLDVETGEVSLFQNLAFERNQDACSCPFRLKLLNRVSVRTSYPCTKLEFEITILNRSGRTQSNLRLRDTFPPGTVIESISELPFSATIGSGINSQILDIRNIVVPPGEYPFVITLDIQNQATPQIVLNQAYLDNVILNAQPEGIRLPSDDPQTPANNDPTRFSIRDLAVTFNDIEPVLCPGDTLVLESGVSGADSYQWSTGESSPGILVTMPGEYAVTVYSSCEEAQSSIYVWEDDMILDLGGNRRIEKGEVVNWQPDIFSQASIQLYYWEESPFASLSCLTCPNPSSRPVEDTRYALTIENTWGCRVTDLAEIEVVGLRVYAPNVFSPNFDHRNDEFYLQSPADYAIHLFQVFDRWGNLLFERKNGLTNVPDDGWDGTRAGQPAAPGVYVWYATVVGLNGEEQLLSGDVTLMR